MGCFPLTTTGRPEAVLALFAGATDVFDDEETRLILELAGDITFALDHLKNLMAYVARVEARPSAQKALSDEAELVNRHKERLAA